MIKKQSSTKAKPSAARNLEGALRGKKPKQEAMRLIPAHISVDEVIGFNSLQATEENPTGQYIDPESGLREYSRLSAVLRVPKIRDLFIKTADLFFSDEPIPKEIEDLQKQPMPGEENGLIPIPSDNDPAVQGVADAGEGKDKILVMMPEDVVHFLDILQGGKSEDPEFGLQQFGAFDFLGKIGNKVTSVVRVAATVVGGIGGFMVGGPAGAAAGAYLGNAAGRMGTGQKLMGDNPAWKAAAPNALYGYAGGHAFNAAVGAGFGSATTAPKVAPIVNGVASTAPPAAAPIIAGSTPALAPPVIPPVAPPATGMSGLLASAKPYMLPAALMGGAYFMSKKGDKEKQGIYEQQKAERENEMRELHDYEKKGLEGDLYLDNAPDDRTRYGYNYGKYRKKPSDKADLHLKKGGTVKVLSTRGNPLKGPGKGQDDLIHKSIPEYTWIHDAHTVSALGDGTTDAGHKEIHAFENKIKKEMLPFYKDQLMKQIKEKKPRQVACAVANGEHETPLLLVGALGEGSFEKGAKVLRKMTRAIRQHKSSKKHDLPSAAHELSVYYNKAIKGK
jgi:hypothetical protein